MEEARPLLAICRGIQVLNVGLGGTLYQDIQAQIPGASRHDWYPGYARDRRPHTVAITPGSRLAGIVEADLMRVNSLHHQSLRDVASRLAVTARAPDDVIEAVEADDHPFAIGVQWHPEELADDDPRAQHLFDAFVGACRL
jgi:putative glutamine amidotransferase